MLTRARSAPLVGLWAQLDEVFTLPVLAHILGLAPEEVTDYARNRYPMPAAVAGQAQDLAELHGVTPTLYQQWHDHRGVLIASMPCGWMAWSLNSTRGWLENSRWVGNPADLIPCSQETVALARAKNWRY